MNYKRFKNVFKFTGAQLVKGKSFKISTIIILAIVFLGTSLINIIPAVMNKDKNNSDSNNDIGSEMVLKSIYYKDTSDLKVDISSTIKATFPNINFENSTDSDEKIIEKISNTEESEVYIKTVKENSSYILKVYEPPTADLVKAEDVELVTSIITSNLNTGRLVNAGVSPEKIGDVISTISTKTIVAGEDEKSFEQIIAQTILPMVACILLFYIIYFYGYWVANSIVAEKTSRVMELLLTTLKPIELITGKCFAMGSLAIAQFTAIIITALASYEISGIMVKKFIDSTAKTVDLSLVFSTVSILDIVWIVLFFILGYTLYAVLNALVGATVSKLEDLNMAMMPVSLLSMIGFYLAYMATAMPDSGISKLAAIIPFSSPFYIPAAIISSDIPIMTIAIALLVIIVSIILLILFTARVYSVVILHTGNRLKFKDLFFIFNEEK